MIFAQTVTVNLSSEAQEIKGYGGINHPEWAGDLTATQRATAFGNGPGQMGLSILRIFVNENSNSWNQAVATAKYASDRGVTVFASPWNPPSNMTRTVNGAKRINPSSFGAYAQHLNSFVNFMKDAGVDLYAISVQNEPDYAHDWTAWSPEEGRDFIKGYANSIDCRIMSPESFQYTKRVYDPILNDADALAKTDIFGAHTYGTRVSQMPYPLFKQKGAGKELWMTEVYVPNSDNNSADRWPEALDVGEHIHNCMVEAEFQAYVWWYIRRQYGPMKEDGSISKRGYMMCHFSKFVRPGFVRVAANKSPTSNVYVSAYKKDNDVVLVIVNKNTSSKTISFSIPGTKVTTWERYVTTGSKNLSKESDLSGGASFQVTLDAQSMTTIVGAGNAGFPNVEITSPANNEVFVGPATIEINATATDDNGQITNVEFYNGDTKLGEDASAPYSFTWSDVAPGEYTVRVVATDNENNKGESIAPITVNIPQGPYSGTPASIPGTIQVENFDVGGNGFAYMDETAENTGGADFRMDEDVDIENCTDAGAGYNLGFATAGEWLEYTVDVKTAGKYTVTLRAACNGDGRTVALEANGKTIDDNIALPNTGDWQGWENVVVNDVQLEAGMQVLKLTVGATDYVNINYIKFELATPLVPPVLTITAPANNSAYGMSESISISATATSQDASIANVAFYVDDELLTTDNSSPYTYSLADLTLGEHEITVVATDSDGASTTKTVTISVVEHVEKVQLTAGWNLVGCPIEGSTDVNRALSSIWSEVEVVKDLDGFMNTSIDPTFNSLSKLIWGGGYMVKVKSDCELDWKEE